jgi:fermentation-respiration switch protein FrsA (DUF1100 family)
MPYWNRKNVLKNLLGLALLPLAAFFFLRWFEHRQVYFPSRSVRAPGEAWGHRLEEIGFKAADGTLLNAWFFPSASPSPRGRFAILLCHGNAGNISHRLELYELLLQTGVNLLAFDYRGYGLSSGRPSEEGTYQDAEAAYQWLRRRGFEAKNIVALGESLGGGVASELALRVPLGGLILQSTFTSVPAIGAEIFPWLPVKTLSRIKYDTLSKLPRIQVPVLVMHSPSDSLVGFQHGKRNFAAANEPRFFWEIAGDHNDALLADHERFLQGINQFLSYVENPMSKKL